MVRGSSGFGCRNRSTMKTDKVLLRSPSMRELFREWIDPDVAEYYLACAIELMDFDEDLNGMFWENKGVFNTRNRIGNMLYEILEKLVESSVLEKNDDAQYRWKPDFKGHWEGGPR